MADHDNNGDRTSNRGFASMDPKRRQEIARKGGQASHGGDKARHGNDNKENSDSDESSSETSENM